MFSVTGDGDRLVDQQHGNAVLDAVRAPKPRVVEELVVNQQKRAAVLRAYQDAQQLVVEHVGALADRQDDAAAIWSGDADAGCTGSGHRPSGRTDHGRRPSLRSSLRHCLLLLRLQLLLV